MDSIENYKVPKVPILKRIKSSDNTYLLLGLAIYIVICSIIAPQFVSKYNVSVLLEQMTVPGILAVGMCLVMVSGGIDLSVGQLLSFAACSMAGIIYNGGNVYFAIIVGIILCLGCELLMGYIVSRTTLEPFIVSLGFMSIYQGFANITTNGAEYPIPGVINFATNIRFANIPIMVFIALLISLLFALILRYTRFGRWLFAVGDNPEASFYAGINVRNFKLSVYGINGILVGIASVLLLSRNEVGVAALGTGLEMKAIGACVVGGVAMAGGIGNILGVLIGTVWMGIISNSLNIIGVSSFVQYVVTGAIIIVAVLVNSLRIKK